MIFGSFTGKVFKLLKGSPISKVPGSFRFFSLLCSMFGAPILDVFNFKMQSLVYRKYVLFYSEDYERNVVNVFKKVLLEYDSPIVVDVGASIGFYTLIAATTTNNTVYGIEPDPFRFFILNKNFYINKFKNIKAMNSLASSERGRSHDEI